jgi:hypothetical protein
MVDNIGTAYQSVKTTVVTDQVIARTWEMAVGAVKGRVAQFSSGSACFRPN